MPITTTNPITLSLANAIALANGYNVSGSTPNNNNNPGNLKNGNVGFGVDSQGNTVYGTPEMGNIALQNQAAHALNGDSKTFSYNPNTTPLSVIGRVFAPNDAVWMSNVTTSLGVKPSTPLGAIASGKTPVTPYLQILPNNKLTLQGTIAGQPQPTDAATNQKQVQGSLLNPTAAVPVAGQDITTASYAALSTNLQVSPDPSMSMTPWFSDTKLLTGNPRIRKSVQPVSFQVYLSQSTGEMLTDNTGQPVTLELNASMGQFSVLSKHIFTRTPSRTGMHITFWGMAADTISGQATSGVFMNATGITDYFSTAKITDDIATQIGAAFSNNPDAEQAIAANPEAFRVAAQDAFVEFLKLFQMNGLVWYNTPSDQNQLYLNGQSQSAPAAWSPQTGATNFQQNARNNDVRSKGYVIMSYRNNKYLGYFKTLSWQMDAEKPFQWTFNFTFQVERTLTAYYYPKAIAPVTTSILPTNTL